MKATERSAIAAALAAYVIWGLNPIYFIALAPVPTVEILANRIVWSAFLVLGLILALGLGPAFVRALRTPLQLLGLIGSSICITVNWGFYAWAVPHGYALDAGFGYLVNPLVSVLLGFAVLREPLSPRRWIAVALAALGVAALAYARGGIPWLVLILPVSFGLYGLLRKVVPVDPLVGLAVEVSLAGPIAAAYLATLPGGGAITTQGVRIAVLLLALAPVTSAPLFLFAYAARRLSLATMGVLQYVSPTLQMALASLVLGEAFTVAHAVALGLIWLGIAVYSFPIRAGVDNGRAQDQIPGRAMSD